MRINALKALAVFVLLGFGSGAYGQTPVKQRIDPPAIVGLGAGLSSSTAKLNGMTLHYVRGGAGPAVILLHGFPQDWYAYHRIMPRLAKSFTVIAADMRGVGRSTAPAGGFDAIERGRRHPTAAATAQAGAGLCCRTRQRRDDRVHLRTPVSEGNARRHDPRLAAPWH